MFMRSLVIAGLAGVASLMMCTARADDAAVLAVANGATFVDPANADLHARPVLNLSLGQERAERSPNFTPYAARERETPRRYEMALGARGVGGLDVSIAQRASFGVDAHGDISSRGRGAELRLGRGVNMPRRKQADWDHPAWYAFAASDDEAVTWRPGVRNAFGDPGPSFALQDRVEIGDRQAGLTYERGPLQASLAYVERSVDARSNGRMISRDERFTGITLTMRH